MANLVYNLDLPGATAMEKPIVRALTYFTKSISDWSRSVLASVLSEAFSVIDEASSILDSEGFMVWSKRVTLPQPPVSVYSRLGDILSDLVPSDKYYLSVGGVYIDSIDYRSLYSIVERGFYTPLFWRSLDGLKTYVEYTTRLSRVNPLYCMKICLSMDNKPLQSPYYPLSTSIKPDVIGLAFLYPDKLLPIYLKNGLEGVRSYIEGLDGIVYRLEPAIGRKVYIDYSVSPWREASVAELVEAIGGTRIWSPTFLYGIHLLNKILREHSIRVAYSIGFNRVMLPYIEDNVLVKAGREGWVRARDFLLYACSCVAGVDTVVLPLDKVKLYGYVRAVYSIAYSLDKPLGLRIIPVGREPGERVKLEYFGSVAVLDY